MRRTNTGEFRAFGEHDFSVGAADVSTMVRRRIQEERPDYLLNVNEDEYFAHLTAELQVEPLEIDFAGVSASPTEKDVPAEYHPHNYFVERGGSYRRAVVVYHVPVRGNLELLRATPNPRVMSHPQVRLDEGALCFEIIDFQGDSKSVKPQADGVLDALRTNFEHLRTNVAAYNQSVAESVPREFRARREQLRQRHEGLETLGVPIRKAANIPQTFAVPAVTRKVIPRPAATATTKAALDPALDESLYQDILQTIHDTGKTFERLPSTYAGKDEETLRDHLILVLEPRFEGSTTGETFNKKGKTDILLRYQKSNLFVAECKIWHGEKEHLGAIDQLLSYLTWRDSKAALIHFVRGKQIAPVLKAVETSTPNHPQFVRAHASRDESWFNYEFRLPGDADRSVRVAVLCFHFPAD